MKANDNWSRHLFEWNLLLKAHFLHSFEWFSSFKVIRLMHALNDTFYIQTHCWVSSWQLLEMNINVYRASAWSIRQVELRLGIS